MIYKSIDELKEAYKKEKKESSHELDKQLGENGKKKKKLFLIILLSYLFIFLLVRFTIKEILFVVGSYQGTPLYKVYVNSNHVLNCYTSIQRYPILPGIFNLGFGDYGCYSGKTELNVHGEYEVISGEKVVLQIDAFDCYTDPKYHKNSRIKCNDKRKHIRELNDREYEMMIIIPGRDYEEIYEGEYVSDITEYLNKKGSYLIRFTDKYGLTTTDFEIRLSVK